MFVPKKRLKGSTGEAASVTDKIDWFDGLSNERDGVT
jgi:hypothetical protein